ncbi:MAG: orotate phosphoribosyltransferase [Nitrososphaerales archaeon]|nr:orotate phosphoribosyltransferase [Nitrososphaerales archaeon]
MPSRPPTKRQIAEALFKIGAVRFGKFTLASGKTSSYYLDLRTVPSHPDAYSLVVEAYKEAVRMFAESAFDVIAGVATAGVTISSPLAFLLKKPMVYVRKEEKGHGMGKLVMGAVQRGSRALVVDDVATTGGSILSAVEALRSEGVVVEKALVLVDRLEGGSESLRSAGVELVSVLDMKELAEELYGSKLVGRAEYDSIVAEASRGSVKQ